MKRVITVERPSEEPSFRGFSLHEIKMRRAYLKVKSDLLRQDLAVNSKALVKSTGIKVPGSAGKGIISKLAGSLDYFDYAFLAFTAGSRLWKLISRWRGRKKS